MILGRETVDLMHSSKQRLLVKDGGVVIMINFSDEDWLREDLSDAFRESDIVLNTIHVKRLKPVVLNGFHKDLESLFVLGEKSAFQYRSIRSFHDESLKKTFHNIIGDIVDSSESVLYVFNEATLAFDLDPLGLLYKKQVKVEYVSREEIVDELSSKLMKRLRM